MSSGENQQALRKIPDLIRGISLVLLMLHLYYYCSAIYPVADEYPLIARLLGNVAHAGFADRFTLSRLLILAFLAISLIGVRGRKDERYDHKSCIHVISAGLTCYFGSPLLFYMGLPPTWIAAGYLLLLMAGWLLILAGGIQITRVIRQQFRADVFNNIQQTFPQETRRLDNEYSLNFPARFVLGGLPKKSCVNIVNPFRGLLILGNPGCGKSRYLVRPIIEQHIRKKFSMVVYDFKYEELSLLTYNLYLQYRDDYPIPPQFYLIQFDDLSRSHRCNPLDKAGLFDITDAAESARTILLGLNRDWIQQQGSFWVESPINFLTALIWFLRNYEEGKYCTLPHVIELAQTSYGKLFTILRTDPQLGALVNPFVNAYLKAPKQLEGQIASATIGLARLASPKLYWVLTGEDLTLDINNPAAPKILCLGNTPAKTQVYGCVLSLYMSSVTRTINRSGQAPCSLVLDEFPTLYFSGFAQFLATARSQRVAMTMAVQDASQLRVYYGREQADTILNISGNIIAGQLRGDAAKQVSDSIGRIQQERESMSVNSEDTSFTRSKHLDAAVPVSMIARLSAGEFVGVVADNPDQRISLKAFCCAIDPPSVETEPAKWWQPLPAITDVDEAALQENYDRVRQEVEEIIEKEVERIVSDARLSGLVIT